MSSSSTFIASLVPAHAPLAMSPPSSPSREVGIVSTNVRGSRSLGATGPAPSPQSDAFAPPQSPESNPLDNTERFVEVAGVGSVKWGTYRCAFHGNDLELCLENCTVDLNDFDDDRTVQVPEAARSESASVFDILNIFRRRLFMKREAILDHITLASKDECGSYTWVVLDKDFHNTMMARAIWTVAGGTDLGSHLRNMVKRTFFVFVLEILSVRNDVSFFTLSAGETKHNSAQQEKKRLARKNARAAKRECRRVAIQDAKSESNPSRRMQARKTCGKCHTTFATRGLRKRHTCNVGSEEEAGPSASSRLLVVNARVGTGWLLGPTDDMSVVAMAGLFPGCDSG
ncbi:hypothetical protein BJY52DRAFT_1215850 [Lactarius psammicola]|nr:hypothetical protein BJY52DRAFT_1215850 [Lactarius psammicola]